MLALGRRYTNDTFDTLFTLTGRCFLYNDEHPAQQRIAAASRLTTSCWIHRVNQSVDRWFDVKYEHSQFLLHEHMQLFWTGDMAKFDHRHLPGSQSIPQVQQVHQTYCELTAWLTSLLQLVSVCDDVGQAAIARPAPRYLQKYL